MKLLFEPQTLYFKHPFKIAHGVRSSTDAVIIKLHHEGFVAYGEASMPPYLGETHASVIRFLELSRKYIESIETVDDLEPIIRTIDSLALGNTAAKASLDIALRDLKGKMLNKPCHELFDASIDKAPYSTFTIGIDTPEVIIKKLGEAEDFKILKVKLSGVDDHSIIDTIRSVTDKPIAVDVNQGWKTREEAIRMIEWLSSRNVLFVEQPLQKDDLGSSRWIFERSPLPIYADESVQRLSDIDKVKDCFHGINIKLMKCTGLYEASQMIIHARRLNLKVLIGCMSETSCAVSAAAQLAPLCDHADLDGPLLIRNDLFTGIKFINGKITLNSKPGIGVEPAIALS